MPTFSIRNHQLLSSGIFKGFESFALKNSSINQSIAKGNRNKKMKPNKGIKRGDRILTEQPFVYALKSIYRKERCDNCLAAGKVLKCSNCQYVYYCNRDCQTQSWLLHKFECPFLKKIHPKVVPDAARILCRIIIRLDNGGDLVRGYFSETGYRKFRDLMSHYAEIKDDPQRIEHLESLHGVLCEMMGETTTIVPNKTELMSIYGRLITNGFNILDREMNTIGTAIYLGVSITDHSCKPNAVATFEGRTLHVHAIEDMECLDFSKIFISYIEVLNTPEQRRADLKKNYYFYCTCTKCIDPQETLEMNAAKCAKANCNEFLDLTTNENMTECSRCGTGISPKLRNGFNEAMQLTKSNLENMNQTAYLDACKICLKKQHGFLHPLNLWHVKTLDAAFEAAISMNKWSEALEYGIDLIPGFRKYYGDWNPLLGLLFLKIAKIQLFEGDFKEAIKNFQQAKQILEVTHGRDHSLLQEQLLPMLMQATMENTKI